MADRSPDGAAARPRVAVLSSVHRWNDTRIYVKQAASLAASGYDVMLAAIAPQPQPFVASGVRVVPLPKLSRRERWKIWQSIVKIVRRENPAIVHVHDPELIPFALFFKLTGRKAVCDIHENVSEQLLQKEWLPKPLRRPMSALVRVAQRMLPHLADAVVLAEDSYVREFPSAANVSIVRNFPIPPRRSKQDYATDTLRLIYVGDVRLVRGIAEYVAITAELAARGVPVITRIVGSFADAGEEAHIRAELKRLGIEDRVELLGRRPPEDLPALLDASDVGLALLHPIGNYRESYPTKMFEYMGAGLPVVASDFPLWASVLIDNDCGRVVDPLNVDAAATMLSEYWSSAELRERHGRNGRAAVLERYDWRLEFETLLNVYRSL